MALLAIDIETGGKDFTFHPLVAIGTCFYGPYGSKEKRLFVMQFDTAQFEYRCMQEFWLKHPDKLQFFQEYKEKSSLQDFIEYVDSLDQKYKDLTLVTDNPAFDIGFLNAKLCPRSVQYPITGGYRIPLDTNSFLWAMLVQKDRTKYLFKGNWVCDADVIKEFDLTLTSVHDHRPDNDAEWIGDLFLAVINK